MTKTLLQEDVEGMIDRLGPRLGEAVVYTLLHALDVLARQGDMLTVLHEYVAAHEAMWRDPTPDDAPDDDPGVQKILARVNASREALGDLYRKEAEVRP